MPQKSKEQLIEELNEMQIRVKELEARIEEKDPGTHNKRRATREQINAEIEFIGDFDIIQAEGVNVSRNGICFKLKKALPMEMQFTYDGITQRKRAELVWVKQLDDEGYSFGLKFTDNQTKQEF